MDSKPLRSLFVFSNWSSVKNCVKNCSTLVPLMNSLSVLLMIVTVLTMTQNVDEQELFTSEF